MGVPGRVGWSASREALLAAPLPVLWWRDRGGLFKKAARKQLALSHSLTELCWESYFDIVSAPMQEAEEQLVTAEGRVIVPWLLLFGSVQDHQMEGIETGCSRVPDPSLIVATDCPFANLHDGHWRGIPLSFPNGEPDRFDEYDRGTWFAGYIVEIITEGDETMVIQAQGSDELTLTGRHVDLDSGHAFGEPVILKLAAVRLIEVA